MPAASPRFLADSDELRRSSRGIFWRALTFLAMGGFVLATICPPSVRAKSVTATVAAGNGPDAVAVDPVTNTIYVANFNSSNVTVIDGATKFYCSLLGWTATPIVQKGKSHVIFSNGGRPVAGLALRSVSGANHPSRWIGYYAVSDTALAPFGVPGVLGVRSRCP